MKNAQRCNYEKVKRLQDILAFGWFGQDNTYHGRGC